MRFYEQFDEKRAISGIGSAIYVRYDAMQKFAFLMALETIPAFSASKEAIEINVTSSPVNTKVEGKSTLEDKEVEFLLHRDNLRRLKALEGKTVDILRLNQDFTGERASGTISFVQNDSTSTDPAKGTIKITLSGYEGYVDNCYDMLMPTAKFVSAIDDIVYLDSTDLTETKEIVVETNPTDATIEGASEKTSIATIGVVDKTVTITPVAKGSTVVTLTAKKTDYASWTTTILVIVQ